MRYGLFILLLLMGFWLRLVLHDAHGLEGDDGVTIHLLRIETGMLIDGLRRQELDVHPPLYFVLMQAWTSIAGDSLLSLRLFNIAADLLVGALLLRLTKIVLHAKAALAAGILWLCAPLLLYTLYPIRMYPLLGLFVMGGAVCILTIISSKAVLSSDLKKSPPKSAFFSLYLGLFFCTLAALYTHIFGGLAAAAYVLTLLMAKLRRILSGWDVLIGCGVIVLAGILFLPFGLPMVARLTSGSALGAQASSAPGNVWEIPGQLLQVMLSHRVMSDGLIGTVIFAILLMSSLYYGIFAKNSQKISRCSGTKNRGILFILTWTMIGGAIFLAVAADIYRPRYVAPFVPLLLATISVLLWQIQRRFLRGAIFLCLVVMSGIGLIDNLRNDAYDDWRAAAQFLEKMARPEDKIIIIPSWGAKAFGYHYQGDTPISALLPGITPDIDLEPLLNAATTGHDRVWLVRYQVDVSDPTNRADAWFRERAVTLTEVYPTAIQVKGYDFNPTVQAIPAFVRPLDANFEGVMHLRGIDMPIMQGSGRDVRLHPPSNWINLTLYWEKLQAYDSLMLRVRLTDVIGNTWGVPLERDNDLLHRQPLSTWALNTLYEVTFDVNLNPVIPPGDYYIEVMVLDAATGTPLKTTGADAGDFWAIAGKFTITAGA